MGIFSKLFCRREADSRTAPTLSTEQIEAVVNAYGGLLAQGHAGSGVISDTKFLPYPKETIKAALITALRITTDKQMRENLKVAYISLADFQDGVGPNPIGVNLLGLDLNADPLGLAQTLANQSPMVADFQKKSDAEMQDLKGELVAKGLW